MNNERVLPSEIFSKVSTVSTQQLDPCAYLVLSHITIKQGDSSIQRNMKNHKFQRQVRFRYLKMFQYITEICKQ